MSTQAVTTTEEDPSQIPTNQTNIIDNADTIAIAIKAVVMASVAQVLLTIATQNMMCGEPTVGRALVKVAQEIREEIES